jgi:hypothetical protein
MGKIIYKKFLYSVGMGEFYKKENLLLAQGLSIGERSRTNTG